MDQAKWLKEHLDNVLRWLPGVENDLARMCSSFAVPFGLAVGWIELESGGNPHEKTPIGEVSVWQISPEEAADMGLDIVRLEHDPQYGLSAGFELVHRYQRAVGRLKVPNLAIGTEYYWRLVKLGHSMGGGAMRRLMTDAINQQAYESWDLLKPFALSNTAKYLKLLKHSPAKWFEFVDRVFLVGKSYGVSNQQVFSNGAA